MKFCAKYLLLNTFYYIRGQAHAPRFRQCHSINISCHKPTRGDDEVHRNHLASESAPKQPVMYAFIMC